MNVNGNGMAKNKVSVGVGVILILRVFVHIEYMNMYILRVACCIHQDKIGLEHFLDTHNNKLDNPKNNHNTIYNKILTFIR